MTTSTDAIFECATAMLATGGGIKNLGTREEIRLLPEKATWSMFSKIGVLPFAKGYERVVKHQHQPFTCRVASSDTTGLVLPLFEASSAHSTDHTPFCHCCRNR